MPNIRNQSKCYNKASAVNQKKLPTVQVRRLKVSCLSAKSEMLSYRTWQTRSKVPFLKLSGKWLEEAGFNISSTVSIIVKDNLLIIEPLPENDIAI